MDAAAETALLLSRATGLEGAPLSPGWADALGMATVGEVCDRARRFRRDLLAVAGGSTHPRDLREVYWGDTGVPSLQSLSRYLDTANRRLRDILDDIDRRA